MSKAANYYYRDLERLVKFLVPRATSSVVFNGQKLNGKYDYIIIPNTFAYTRDVQKEIRNLRRNTHSSTKLIVIYFNFAWKPLLDLASKLGLRKKDIAEPNWLTTADFINLFRLENFDLVKQGKRFLFPVNLGLLSQIINKYFAQLPIINSFCLTTYLVVKPKSVTKKYSVSIIIPARNEAGNMKGVLNKIPKLGSGTEVIFVEGHSKDDTYKAIENEIKRKSDFKASLYRQKGKGKGDAVRLGFSKAKNDILMILDADLTVSPNDLYKFYEALSNGHADFANGSRLVYPMEAQAMRTLNYFGNTFFGLVFSFLLGQRVKDTLCGTKVLLKKDYLQIARNRNFFGDFDPFGDFDLLFGASKLNLKIIDIPVRYKERVYGTTNISRFKHGILLIKMTLFAAQKLKFI